MSTIKKREKGYTQVSNALLNDKGLSLKAKGLYAFMDSKPDGWNFTIRSLAAQLKEGSEAVQSAINELKDAGYLRYHKQSDGHGVYELIDDPNQEKPNQGFPKKGKPERISNKDSIAKKIDRKPPLPPEGESHQQRRSGKHSSPVDAPPLPDWLNLEAWSEWESYRKEKKKPITPTARKRHWSLLQCYTKQEQRIVIDRSINSGWTGLFELKDQDRPKHKPKVMVA